MVKLEIDIEEFTKLYSEGVSHRDLAKKYGCGTTKIQNLRREQGLPIRLVTNKITQTKNVNEKRFRKMYDERLSYQQIGEAFRITTVHTVAKYVKILNFLIVFVH